VDVILELFRAVMDEPNLNLGFQATRTVTAVGRLNARLHPVHDVSFVSGRGLDLINGLTLHTVDHPGVAHPFSAIEDVRSWFVEFCIYYWKEADIKNLRLFWESPDDPALLNAVLWGGWHIPHWRL
jgi:hypothetical protein